MTNYLQGIEQYLESDGLVPSSSHMHTDRFCSSRHINPHIDARGCCPNYPLKVDDNPVLAHEESRDTSTFQTNHITHSEWTNLSHDRDVPTPVSDNELSVSTGDNDFYPEYFALEEDERPLLGTHDESVPRDFFSQNFGVETFKWVLERLAQNNVSPEEVMLLWYHLITEKQRWCILKQLQSTGPGDYSPEASMILNETLLSGVIKAWADLKQQIPPKLGSSHDSAQQVAMNILQYCIFLEQVKAEGLPMALKYGFVKSDPFSHPPIIGIDFDRETPLERFIKAFAERVKCRKVHPEWLSFTNVMVLREMVKYIRELKEVILAIMPCLKDRVRDSLQKLEE